MSQFLGQVVVQEMRQEMRLTPQMIQSMDILQLPLMALENRITEELQSNCMLERTPEPATTEATPEERQEPSRPEGDDGEAAAFERLDRLSREYDFDVGDRGYGRPRDPERDAKMEAMANTASRPISLQEHLLQQWSLVDAPEPVKRAGEAVINYLEPDGYLRSSLEEVSRSVVPVPAPEHLEQALTLVQGLEPTGVGARNLSECLLLQLNELPGDHTLEKTLVRDHLVDLQKNRFPAIAKATECDLEAIKEARSVIGRLEFHPGTLIEQPEVPVVSPDLICEYDEEQDTYTVRLVRGNVPRMRINLFYRKMLEDKKLPKETRDFLRRNLEAATAILEAIQYRSHRLLEVAKDAVVTQRGFLDYGPQHLKVLHMNDLAAKLGCDPSTISRTVSGKYMQTPRGILPLRMFFTSGKETASGESTSWNSVRAQVAEIIANEDKHHPLSDDQIAAKLQSEKLPVKRRTIAKYRAELNIPPARQRKEY